MSELNTSALFNRVIMNDLCTTYIIIPHRHKTALKSLKYTLIRHDQNRPIDNDYLYTQCIEQAYMTVRMHTQYIGIHSTCTHTVHSLDQYRPAHSTHSTHST